MRRDRDQLEGIFASDPSFSGIRVTPKMVGENIEKAQYYQFSDTTVTVCVITMTNGFTTVGSSACADPKNFNEELGRKLAYDDARDKIWTLLGFRLRDQLSEANEHRV